MVLVVLLQDGASLQVCIACLTLALALGHSLDCIARDDSVAGHHGFFTRSMTPSQNTFVAHLFPLPCCLPLAFAIVHTFRIRPTHGVLDVPRLSTCVASSSADAALAAFERKTAHNY